MLDRDTEVAHSDSKVHELAQIWDDVDVMAHIEEPRYPFQRAMGKIVADTFRRYILQNAAIYEVGAGTGFLKDLVPPEYHADYTSSDYNLRHLQEGLKRRKMSIQQANASALPLPDQSVAAVVNLDAYDTFPDLQGAMQEVDRVLTPNGTFIHFQVNAPSDDTVWHDFPGYIFLPPRFGGNSERFNMVGIKREDLENGLAYITQPAFRNIVLRLLANPEEEYAMIEGYAEPKAIIDTVHNIIDAMPVDRITIPSIPDYFKAKLEDNIVASGLVITESGYRSTVVRATREKHNTGAFNTFGIENGAGLFSTNAELKASGSTDVIEKATMLVVVAKKAA